MITAAVPVHILKRQDGQQLLHDWQHASDLADIWTDKHRQSGLDATHVNKGCIRRLKTEELLGVAASFQ